MVNRKVSSAEDDREAELMNVELDREHYRQLVILATLWRAGSPAEMVAGFVEDMWAQLGENIPEDLTLKELEGLACV